MSLWHGLGERLRGLLRSGRADQEMEEEFRFHLEASLQRNIERGLDPEEARRQALRDFGGIERRKEQTRRERGFRWLTDLGRDVQYALRYFRANPGFAAVVVTVMSLGIGANSAIYSLVDSVLFRALPVRDPEQVVRIYTLEPDRGIPRWNAYVDYLAMRERTDLFAEIAAVGDLIPFTEMNEQGAETVLAEVHGAAFLSIIGLEPFLGRGFRPEEDQEGSEPVTMVSYLAWQRRFGSDPDLVGRTVRLNGYPVTVVGIGPKELTSSFLGMVTDYWVPWGTGMLIDPGGVGTTGRGEDQCPVFARLQPGVGVEQVQGALDALAAGLAEQYPETDSRLAFKVWSETDVRVDPMVDMMTTPVAAFLLVVVTLVLLVACSNLAGLLMMRGSVRQREIAIRLALGAGRGRLLRQLLTESALLGLMGGLVGLGIAGWLARMIVTFKPPLPVPIAVDLRFDTSVLLYTLTVSVLTGLAFGLMPALRASRPGVVEGLKGPGRYDGGGRRRVGTPNGLVVFQVAVSVILLVVATLFLRSLSYGSVADPGFRKEGLAFALTDARQGGYRSEESGRSFYGRLVEEVSALPGIERVALASHAPLSIFGISAGRLRLPEQEVEKVEEMRRCRYAVVSPEYFETLGVPLTAGRAFSDEQDAPNAARTAIVNEFLARQLFETPMAVGRSFVMGIGEEAQGFEVVGVVPDLKELFIIERDVPFFYLPSSQWYRASMVVLARSSGPAVPVREALRRTLTDLDRNVPVYEARTMDDQMDFQLYFPRFLGILLTTLGTLTLLLASIGLYGIVSFSVARRTREIGIRMALGADHRQVVRMIMRQGNRLAVIGVVVGLVVVAPLALRFLPRLLFGIHPLDVVTFLLVSLLMLGVTTLANWLPARRTALLDPVRTLRNE